MFPCLSNATDKLDLLFTQKNSVVAVSLTVQAPTHKASIYRLPYQRPIDGIDATLFALYLDDLFVILTILIGI